jgi:hypothetical protein
MERLRTIGGDKISAHNVTFITRWSEDGLAFGHVPDWQLEFFQVGLIRRYEMNRYRRVGKYQ